MIRILFFLLSIMPLSAQIATDFTVITTLGEEVQLYSLLEEGKAVLLEFSHLQGGDPCGYREQARQNFYGTLDTMDFVYITISDRDADDALNTYGTTNSINHRLVGIDGGGNSVLDTWTSELSFKGFPTYAIVCPDGMLTWDIVPNEGDFTAILAEAAACIPSSSTETISLSPEVSIYPNPVSDNLQIHYTGTERIVSTTLYTTTGERVLHIADDLSTKGIDLSSFVTGQYIVELKLSSGGTVQALFQKM